MTAGSQNAQRFEHKPRQQLPAGRGSLDRGLLPTVQTTPQPHTPPSNLNQPGPLIISNPPPLLHKRLPNATLADSTEIQHSPQLKRRGGARQEVTRVGQSGWLQAPVWLGPRRATQIWWKCDPISASLGDGEVVLMSDTIPAETVCDSAN